MKHFADIFGEEVGRRHHHCSGQLQPFQNALHSLACEQKRLIMARVRDHCRAGFERAHIDGGGEPFCQSVEVLARLGGYGDEIREILGEIGEGGIRSYGIYLVHDDA